MCFAAYRQGFLPGCRPIIGVDEIIPAFDEIIPDVAHRFCVRHLHNNYKTEGFGGQALKEVLWKAVRAIIEPEFSKHMVEMSKIDIDAPKWFMNKPLIHWSRSFSLHSQSVTCY